MNNNKKFQCLDQFRLPENFRGKSVVIVQLWWLVQSTFFAWSPQFMYGWRIFLLRLFGAKIGKKVLVRPTVRVTYPWKVSIGDFSWIGDDVVLYTLGNITIGSHTVISQGSYLCTGSHDYTQPSFDIYAEEIKIGDGVWIASDVFISPGVTLGDGAVVGVRSTVLNDLPAGMMCYGYPAKPIRPRRMKTDAHISS
ncbi:MAG: colanic acid biosynthesis acetyltransferase WcaF [Chloroflexi bacterium GWB2_49_20]|nr:MAG: colanic acid biosynthesis acetyltransferase WcaF [Chloroflexi bacterium GWB2_49_20]OGN76114.1 MAG: colanic acid biosynthesis acetyltransferase WcaF [Chloroflexi bacterium GWC2_49_37]OGN83500.1 MAG: colanic acid biosynthesis acetyltransferase WcaF [Chloroflexi bacterium GWD2_49_16]HBG73901.1 colanic acid biosynthesis acetyltransferase WcaF [Anaerolineae bacterium]HCC79520.1 colanic acid biosynthesis acetyltransferase WcaF [Anaerolineae bacterium]